jgi:hypothetical protein
LPTWIQRDGPQAMVERLDHPEVVRRLHTEWFPSIRASVLDRVTLSHVGCDPPPFMPDAEWGEQVTDDEYLGRQESE